MGITKKTVDMDAINKTIDMSLKFRPHNPNPTRMTIEEKALYQRIVAVADLASVTRTERNQLFHHPPPDEEGRLCRDKTELTMEEIQNKLVNDFTSVTELETQMIISGATYNPDGSGRSRHGYGVWLGNLIDDDYRIAHQVHVGHYLRIVSNSANISVIDGDSHVGAESYSSGISSGWEKDDTGYLVGSPGMPFISMSGPSEAATSLTPFDGGSNGVIRGDYFGYSNNNRSDPICHPGDGASEFGADWTPDLQYCEPQRRRKKIVNLSILATPQLTPSRSTGNPRSFTVHTPSGASFIIISHTYPNGQNGAHLISLNANAGYYELANPDNCEDVTVTSAGQPTSSYVTEHIIGLGTFKLILEWMMLGTFPRHDGTILTSTYTPVPEKTLNTTSFFQTPWNQWSTLGSASTPMDDIWTAFGDMTNPTVLVNCESVFNNVKMQIWQGNNPMADTTWTNNDFNNTSKQTGSNTAQGGISIIRKAAAIFSYLNETVVNANMAKILNSIHKTFAQFDEEIFKTTGATIHTKEMFTEFFYCALIPRLEAAQVWAERRIDLMYEAWEAKMDQPTASTRGKSVDAVLTALEKLLEQVDDVILINTSGLNFHLPPPI